jgi:hypothetical protein
VAPGDIDVRGDAEAGEALVDEHLDPVILPLEGPRDAGVERRALGKTPQGLDEPLAHGALAFLDAGRGVEARHGLVALLPELARALAQGGVDHLPQAADDLEGILRDGAVREEEKNDGDPGHGDRPPARRVQPIRSRSWLDAKGSTRLERIVP